MTMIPDVQALGSLHAETLEEAFAEYVRLLTELDAADRERHTRVHAIEEAGPEFREGAILARAVIGGLKAAGKTHADHWFQGELRRLL